MKSLLDLLRDESFLITKYNQHIEDIECWASERADCNPESDLEIECKIYQHYIELEKESRDKALKCEFEISKVRQEILEYLTKIEEDERYKKSLLTESFEK